MSQEWLRPRQHTSCSPKIISASAAIANLFHRACMPWILSVTPVCFVVVGRAENPDFCCAAAHYLDFCIFGSTVQRANTISSWKRGQQRCAPYCLQVFSDRWTLQCFRTKHVYLKASASRSKCCSSRDHTRPHCLSFALAMVLTMNARRFQRTHPLSGMGFSLSASNDIAVGVFDHALVCESESEIDARYAAVVGSACSCVFEAGSDREDRSSDVCYVGNTR